MTQMGLVQKAVKIPVELSVGHLASKGRVAFTCNPRGQKVVGRTKPLSFSARGLEKILQIAVPGGTSAAVRDSVCPSTYQRKYSPQLTEFPIMFGSKPR